jgi:hypothetical protein
MCSSIESIVLGMSGFGQWRQIAGPGVEILSEEHRSLPVREALRRAADSARHQLDLPAGKGIPPVDLLFLTPRRRR